MQCTCIISVNTPSCLRYGPSVTLSTFLTVFGLLFVSVSAFGKTYIHTISVSVCQTYLS